MGRERKDRKKSVTWGAGDYKPPEDYTYLSTRQQKTSGELVWVWGRVWETITPAPAVPARTTIAGQQEVGRQVVVGLLVGDAVGTGEGLAVGLPNDKRQNQLNRL